MRKIIINKTKFLENIKKLQKINNLKDLKTQVQNIKENIKSLKQDKIGLLNIDENGDTVKISYTYLIEEFDKIEKSQTLERAKYYLNRLVKAITEVKTNKINDINLNRWKEYSNIITDSLWILDKRDTSGAHVGWYWGNFIPQIPNQIMLRYTKKKDWVLDTFLGSGTTLIECRRLGRNGIGIELDKEVANKAKALIEKEPNKYNVITEVINGDSTHIDYRQILKKYNINKVQLIIMHPPYHDIIKFSDNPSDLSNAKSLEDFLKMFGKVVDKTYPILENGRYLVVVIGDKYSKGEWIPLGFYVMNEVLKRGYKLKSIVVKNFEETRAKRNQKELWRYRALVGGFYVFKHEYILIFRKTGSKR